MPPLSAKCRLHVLLAREAPVGLIFRRGPTKWTQLIKWNTDSDTFEPGAWFEGRIEPECSDLSPDGTLLLYKAANYSTRSDAHFPAQWTAISKVPWITVLSLWGHSSAYEGGGFFQTSTRIFINEASTIPMWQGPVNGPDAKKLTLPPRSNVYFRRFDNLPRILQERAGWKTTEDTVIENAEDKKLNYRRFVWEKQKPNAPLHLVQTYVHYLNRIIGDINRTVEVRDESNQRISVEGANWIDWDQRGRLVYAREGKLYAAEMNGVETFAPVELADFTEFKPSLTRSPEWARNW